MRDQGLLRGFESYTTEYLNRFLMSRISVRFIFNQVGPRLEQGERPGLA